MSATESGGASRPGIMLQPMCNTHRVLLVRQARYLPSDPWQALEIAVGIALFQAATCDDKVHAEVGGDAAKIPALGCLACRKPDAFGQIVEAAKTHDLGQIKALGEAWVATERARVGPRP